MAASADVCIVGMGTVGGILAKELASAGLKVVGLERGVNPPYADYAARDSIRGIVRHELHESVKHEPIARRKRVGERTRLSTTSSPTNVLGGALMRWTGQSNRFMPGDFKIFTNEIASGLAERAGASLAGYDITDWPIGYEELEPYYTRYEWEMGISGQNGENPFAGLRSTGYPLPPLRQNAKSLLFEDACRRLGYHPYRTPNGILPQPYRPPAPYDQRIPERQGCVYCGHCNGYGCHVQAKVAPLFTHIPVALSTGNFELRTRCKAVNINTDGGGRVCGVSYFDADGSLNELRAAVTIIGCFIYENVRLLLLSKSNGRSQARGLGNANGMVGCGITAHEDVRIRGIFDEQIINGFIGPNSAGSRIDDFNGNNFDHAGLGFIRGGTIGTSGSGTPVERYDVIPPDTPRWGERYKDFFTRYYTGSFDLNIQPETLPHRDNLIDLHPSARDAWGIPLPRVTFRLHDNERKLQRFLARVGERILQAAGASKYWSSPAPRASRWAGGTRMGNDPSHSVVNSQCQVHGLENLFVIGASVFPTMAGYPPTATVAALAYRTADFIMRQRHLFH